MKSTWIKHGFLNTLEHVITRSADAATSLVLLWVLTPEAFSKLALAQALVAPLLFAFVSPEAVLYRDFAQWKTEGPGPLAGRLRAFRLFGWGKAQLALVISMGVALVLTGSEPKLNRFFSMIWAFSLALSPQISATDREYLRLDLQFKSLNGLSLYQKLSLLGGTLIAAVYFPGRLDFLAAAAAFSALSTAWLAYALTRATLIRAGATPEDLRGTNGPSVRWTLQHALQSFSIWSHLTGVIQNWIQTMDLFFLGVFRLPAREVGLYAAALKLANFSYAFPTALANLYSLWINRSVAPTHWRSTEAPEVKRLSLRLFGITSVQGLAIVILAPTLIGLISHGRWNSEEQGLVYHWLRWMIAASVLLSSSFVLSTWLSLRGKISRLLVLVYLPWGLASIAVYAGAVSSGGTHAAAVANVVVSEIYLVLLFLFYKRG